MPGCGTRGRSALALPSQRPAPHQGERPNRAAGGFRQRDPDAQGRRWREPPWVLDQECWFSLLQRRAVQRAGFASPEALDAALHGLITATNADPHLFVRTKSADDILASVSRYCQRTSDSDH